MELLAVTLTTLFAERPEAFGTVFTALSPTWQQSLADLVGVVESVLRPADFAATR